MLGLRRVSILAGAMACCLAAFGATGARADTIYVSNEHDGTVSVIDGATRAVSATLTVGKRPRGLHVSADGRQLYVAVSGSPRLAPGADRERATEARADKAADGIVVVDLGLGRVLRKVSVGSDPEQFALGRDDRTVFVSNEDAATASAWDLGSGRKRFQTPVSDEPEGVALHPRRDELYVTCEERGEVCVLDATGGRELARFHVRGRPRSVAFLPDGSRAYVPAEGFSEVTAVDTHTHAPLRTIAIATPGALPMAAVAAPDGREVLVSTGRGNTIEVIDTRADRVVASIPVGRRVWGLALSRDGHTLYAANSNSNDLSVVDVAARQEIGRIQVGDGPWGVAVH